MCVPRTAPEPPRRPLNGRSRVSFGGRVSSAASGYGRTVHGTVRQSPLTSYGSPGCVTAREPGGAGSVASRRLSTCVLEVPGGDGDDERDQENAGHRSNHGDQGQGTQRMPHTGAVHPRIPRDRLIERERIGEGANEVHGGPSPRAGSSETARAEPASGSKASYADDGPSTPSPPRSAAALMCRFLTTNRERMKRLRKRRSPTRPSQPMGDRY